MFLSDVTDIHLSIHCQAVYNIWQNCAICKLMSICLDRIISSVYNSKALLCLWTIWQLCVRQLLPITCWFVEGFFSLSFKESKRHEQTNNAKQNQHSNNTWPSCTRAWPKGRTTWPSKRLTEASVACRGRPPGGRTCVDFSLCFTGRSSCLPGVWRRCHSSRAKWLSNFYNMFTHTHTHTHTYSQRHNVMIKQLLVFIQ